MGVILISTGPSALELYFCLIHFWEAETGSKGGALIGLELLIIDEQTTLIQAFILSHRAPRYRRLNSNPEIAKEVNA
ncbi:hypothetical protein F2Q68_00035641 [Brassica cretica]|uniref:Uncharacterized protein n=2 Tax=Brassica cretica TaxID=69181 RepID=A0A8S9H4F0_BRACR|nr:hypothetical protein F2Q68_00035641 [Brassica cretica]KAF3593769.1 hypothetical protein DY000_02024233 [Brassica cretica]